MEFFQVGNLAGIQRILAELEMRKIPEYVVSRFSREDLLVQFNWPKVGIFDFCHTLADSQFEAIRTRMSEASREAEATSLSIYESHTVHAEPPIKAKFEAAWIASSVQSMAHDGFTRQTLRELAAIINLREHGSELLNLFERSVIVSAGFRDLINDCLARHDLSAHVISNRLRFEKDLLLGIELDGLVTGSTKGDLLRAHINTQGIFPHLLLVVGDHLGIDGTMMFASSVNVLVRRTTGALKSNSLNKDNWDRLSCITSSLKPIVQLLREARR